VTIPGDLIATHPDLCYKNMLVRGATVDYHRYFKVENLIMQMKLLDGEKCVEHLLVDISRKVAGYVESGLRKPHMTIILVCNHALP
jgi:hypothetical protein